MKTDPKGPFSFQLAEREGFEPSVRLPVLLISSQARSASSGTSPRLVKAGECTPVRYRVKTICLVLTLRSRPLRQDSAP